MLNRQTVLEISEEAFKNNIKEIKEIAKNKILMPVIKANGYGTYINKNLKLLNEFSIVAVAMCSEAIELRNMGFDKEIFVLNEPYKEDISNIIKYNITVGISANEFIDELIKLNEKVKVHLELETGMCRTGILPENLNSVIKKIKEAENIIVEGVYTHLSCADSDIEFTNKQLEMFNSGVKKIKEEFPNIKYIHSSASNGLLNFKNDISNLVRPGIIMYGYESFEGTKNKMNLYPISKLKSKIAYLKTIKKGCKVSYGGTFVAEKDIKVATIGIGYADGLRRALSNKGEVVINKTKAPIIGKVCMDSIMVDVSNIPNVKVGDEVYIWDNELITLEEVAEKCDTINYEIISCISERVPRIFV